MAGAGFPGEALGKHDVVYRPPLLGAYAEELSVPNLAAELWLNGRDSLLHALEHFSERNDRRADEAHHDKWIALSVHHAAECICNMRFVELAPSHPLLRRAPVWFPFLKDTLQALKSPPLVASLSRAEKQLFELLEALTPIRNQFMHRLGPADWHVSEAAMCMIGLLKYAERLRGETASDILWQSLPIESEVMAAVNYRRVEAYCRFAGLFVAEKYPRQPLYECPSCRVEAVANGKCEACYEELAAVTCPETGEPAYYVELAHSVGHISTADCPHCGSVHNI